MAERTADGRLHTTEWEDIQYKHGNRVGQYRDREIDIVAQKLADSRPDAQLEHYDPTRERVRNKAERGAYDEATRRAVLDGEDVPDDADSDDDDNDDALDELRRRRVAEMQASTQSRRGRVFRITGAQYVEEITNASNEGFVVAAMIQDGVEACDSLLRVFNDLAAKHTAVKFVALPANEAIAQFPAKHLPCVLVYHRTKLVTQLTGLDPWGGKHLSRESCERTLSGVGAVAAPKTNDDSDDEGEVLKSSKYYQRGLRS